MNLLKWVNLAMWKRVIFAVLVISILVLGLLLNNRILSAKIDRQNAQIEALQDDLKEAYAEIELLKHVGTRQTQSHEILIERMDQGVGEYVQKMQELDHDKIACDWLDQPLPDVVRKQFGSESCANDSATPTDPIDAMLRTTARIHDD